MGRIGKIPKTPEERQIARDGLLKLHPPIPCREAGAVRVTHLAFGYNFENAYYCLEWVLEEECALVLTGLNIPTEPKEHDDESLPHFILSVIDGTSEEE